MEKCGAILRLTSWGITVLKFFQFLLDRIWAFGTLADWNSEEELECVDAFCSQQDLN
jgi:hypothetical protein